MMDANAAADSARREVGRVGSLAAADTLAALRAVHSGQIFDLDAGRFNGMPQWSGHPKFLITSYRTPAGSRVDGDIELLDPRSNATDFRLSTELLVTGMHIGTHIDALSHAVSGAADDTFYGGYGPDDVGDFGPKHADAASIPPIIVRCAVLDIAGMLGVERMAAGSLVSVDTLREAELTQAPIPRGGALLLRTGLMTTWPDADRFDAASGAGIDAAAARWLANERDVVIVGSDTPTVEQIPSSEQGHPHPVHDYLLRQRGIHLLENVWMEDICAAHIREATLIVLPLKVSGATGSMVRPIALI